jgi:uncharacterized protein YcaQ
MEKLTLSKQQARRFLLSHQGLWPPYKLIGKAGVMEFIQRVGCIQFDPLNIVGHNQELVLQSRIADFRPGLLQDLLYEDRKLVDAWDKNMSIFPVEDWPYFSRNRESARQRLGHSERPAMAIVDQVRQEIEERGPLSSIDLDFDQTVDWSWAPTRLSRAALESMYFWGELIVHHKVHTRKIYDFARRHIPGELLQAPDPNQTRVQYHDWCVLRRIGAIGLLWNRSGDAWLGISGLKSQARQAAWKRLLERQQIIEVQVDGMQWPLYLRSQDKPRLARLLDGQAPSKQAALIAPLDNLLWDRRLIQELFDFEYMWEVYKPMKERRYGYYVLPVLYGDRFVARFEPGKDKQNGAAVIKNWWWEPGVRQSDELHAALRSAFRRFIDFLGADSIYIPVQTVTEKGLGWLEH